MRVGVIVDEGPNSTVTVADAQGKLEVIKRQDIEERHALPTSIMPDNLHEQMTPREFRDLLAYLAAGKPKNRPREEVIGPVLISHDGPESLGSGAACVARSMGRMGQMDGWDGSIRPIRPIRPMLPIITAR